MDASWHARPADDVLSSLGSGPKGLTAAEAAERLTREGPNALPTAKTRSFLRVFVGQFMNPLIYLLLGAAVLALVMQEPSDAIVIFVVVLLNAAIGAFQEGRAEHALAALSKLGAQRAHLLRDDTEVMIDAHDVVPGDVLLVAAGDAVTADARLYTAEALAVAEAALTGESVPVDKQVGPLGEDAVMADRTNMLYAGTLVTAGRGRAVVVSTGTRTEIGHIAALAGSAKPPKTPLEQRIDRFGRAVMIAAVVLFAVIVGIGLLRGIPLAELVMIGISQVVGMVPEGLPVAMTVALAVGVQRMAKRHTIVRRLAAVETLGSTTIVCSDKTGTLTQNEMTVVAVKLPGRPERAVTGSGYAPEGALEGEALAPEDQQDLDALLEAARACNDAQLLAPEGERTRWTMVGDPTEAALLTLAQKLGHTAPLPARESELPFDSAAQMMATGHAGPRILLKGAPEALLTLCGHARVHGADVPLDAAALRSSVEAMGTRALRVLALAAVDGVALDPKAGFEALHGRAVLLGLVGQLDPPRPEAAEAVARCRAAGIRPVMITGDHKVTALAVARALGIARDGDLALDGRELAALDDAALEACIDQVSVFARVHPAQKLRIVETYQRRHEVVAMTGDGVNDAPALVRADVGVAMGQSGTEVAKEAAKIVILDDNFATIVAAVDEGRVVYRNIKKAVLFLFATSLAEVGVLLGAMILGYPPPFAAVQILWNNLVTEGVITINLIMDPAEGDEMKRPPIPTDEPLIDRGMLRRLLVMTPAIVAATLGWFVVRSEAGVAAEVARSEAFTLLAVCEWFNVLSCRSERHSAFSKSLFRNRWLIGGLLVGNLLQVAVIYLPPMNRIFHTVPLEWGAVLAIGAVGSTVLWVEELRKAVQRWREARAVARPAAAAAEV